MRQQLGPENSHRLAHLPFTFTNHDYEAVHTSLNHPEDWPYVLIYEVAAQHFLRQVLPLSFAGHTHQPMLWVEGNDRPLDGCGAETLRIDRKSLVNVRSVGPPRHDAPRNCYVIYHREKREVRWRRLPYDIEGAQCAIFDAGLPPKNAARLELGK